MINNIGEYAEEIYRENTSSASGVYAKIVGRANLNPNQKKVFTNSDILCEGYLFKCGTWFKTWKKRYFILRNDINTLCYFPSKEEFTILGSFIINSSLVIDNPADADNSENVLALTSKSDKGENYLKIRFESKEDLLYWQRYLKELSQKPVNNYLPSDHNSLPYCLTWWNELFSEAYQINTEPTTVETKYLVTIRNTLFSEYSKGDAPEVPETKEGDKDRDSDDEDVEVSKPPAATAASLQSAREKNTIKSATPLQPTKKKHRRKVYKLTDKAKAFSPPPLKYISCNHFARPADQTLCGLQLCLRMTNICGPKEHVVAVLFFHTAASSQGGDKAWVEFSRTEVVQMPLQEQLNSDSAALAHDFYIPFNLLQEFHPDQTSDIFVVIYRFDKHACAEAGRLCSALLPVSALAAHNCCTVPMELFACHAESAPSAATLGACRLASDTLFNQREWMSKNMSYAPYSEVLYSFDTHTGSSLSLEQIFVSKYPLLVSYQLSSLFYTERKVLLEELNGAIESNIEHSRRLLRYRSQQQGDLTEAQCSNVFDIDIGTMDAIEKREAGLSALESVEIAVDLMLSRLFEACEHSRDVLNHQEGTTDKDVVNHKVIPSEFGGCALRRSAWKKVDSCQFFTTNLNVHMMFTDSFTFQELANPRLKVRDAPLHSVPTITLGCPAAHSLKYTDGGMRRTLMCLENDQRRLLWMRALQTPSITDMASLIHQEPLEAAQLFKGCDHLSDLESHVKTLRLRAIAEVVQRKFELSIRLDMCASQALAFALTVVKTILQLAVRFGGHYGDILCRSLKTGFLICFQSLLSSCGPEVGMLEDLDSAALWLSLVKLRLVGPMVKSLTAEAPKYDGINIFREPKDKGDLVVELELSPDEMVAVARCQEIMEGYQPMQESERDSDDDDDGQLPRPGANKATQVELVGIVFSQGVNEMQTLANMSHNKEVTRQTDINNASMKRFSHYYHRKYKPSAHYLYEQAKSVATGRTSDKGKQLVRRDSFRRFNSFDRLRQKNHLADPDQHADAGATGYQALKATDKMFSDLQEAVTRAALTPHDKQIQVLLRMSDVCREIAGTIGILCKSGKDRTSMSVTLDTARSLVNELGMNHYRKSVDLMRNYGVRRMCVHANLGQSFYAFNRLQLLALPTCYRPRIFVCSGGCNS